MNFSYQMYNSINEVNLEDWEQACQNNTFNIFSQPKFLEVVEKTTAKYSKFWHVLFYEQGKPIACTSISTFEVELDTIADEQTKKLINYIRRIFPSFIRFKILFCGLPVSLGQNHLILNQNVNHIKVIEMLNTILYNLAISEKVYFIIYKEFGLEDQYLTTTLKKAGYSCADSLPMNSFLHNFPNFESYSAALKSHYRNDIKRSKRKFENAGLKVVRLQDTEKILAMYTPEVHKLYEAVANKSESKLEVLPAEFFCELAKNFPGQISVVLIYKDKKIVAFNWGFYSNSCYHFLFCGLDYSLNASADLYFNLMYNSLDDALQQNVSKIYVGQTADIFKARLGCCQEPLYIYLKGVGLIPSLLLKTCFNILFPSKSIIDELPRVFSQVINKGR